MTTPANAMSDGFKNGTLTSSTATVTMAGAAIPCTIQLTSSDAARAIQLSIDGTNYYTPTYDASASGYLVVALLAPIKSVKFTGATSDTWVVL